MFFRILLLPSAQSNSDHYNLIIVFSMHVFFVAEILPYLVHLCVFQFSSSCHKLEQGCINCRGQVYWIHIGKLTNTADVWMNNGQLAKYSAGRRKCCCVASYCDFDSTQVPLRGGDLIRWNLYIRDTLAHSNSYILATVASRIDWREELKAEEAQFDDYSCGFIKP
jgi:hypothetical protein